MVAYSVKVRAIIIPLDWEQSSDGTYVLLNGPTDIGATGDRINAGYFDTVDATTFVGTLTVSSLKAGTIAASPFYIEGDSGTTTLETFPTTSTFAITPQGVATSSASFVITTGGKIGIGTTTPNWILSVNDATNGFAVDTSGNVVQGGWASDIIADAYITKTGAWTGTFDGNNIAGGAVGISNLLYASANGELAATSTADLKITLKLDAVENTAISTWAGSANILTVGALDAGSITSNFGTINTGASAITTTGLITGGTLSVTNATTTGQYITGLATPAGAFLAVDTTGQVIATTTPSSAGGGLTWGDSITDTSAIGTAWTLGTNSGLGTAGGEIIIDDTQTNGLTGLKIDTGASSVGHTGILVNAEGASTSQRGVRVDMGSTGTGQGYSFVATSGSKATIFKGSTSLGGVSRTGSLFSISASGSPGSTINDFSLAQFSAASYFGYNYIGLHMDAATNYNNFPTGNDTTFSFFAKNNNSDPDILYGYTSSSITDHGIYGWHRIQSNTARTSDINIFSVKRNKAGTATPTDNFSLEYLKRENISDNVTGSLTATGSVLKIENVATETAGTLTDSVTPLIVINDADSTGVIAQFSKATATSTIEVGTTGQSVGSCLQMYDVAGTGVRLFIVGTTVTVETGTCQ